MWVFESRRTNHLTSVYKPGMLIPVYPSSVLLESKRHQFLLEHVLKLSHLTTSQYNFFYEGLVKQFVDFVQVLPINLEEPLGSLMNQGLLRGVNSLDHYIKKNFQATALERYAVFSAALLLDVVKVVVNQKIFITDEEGNFVKQWNPFEGSLTGIKAEFYKIMPLSSACQRNCFSITPILAHQLLSKEGFLWLSSNRLVFSYWLEALGGEDIDGAGTFSNSIQLFKYGTHGLFEALPNIPVQFHESPATAHADAFLRWLQEGLKTKKIKVNKPEAGIYVIRDGVFLEKAGIFKQYIDLHVNTPVNLFTVYQQFGNLFGLTKLSGSDYRFEQLFSSDFSKNKIRFVSPVGTRDNSIREGVLISDPNLIFTCDIPLATPYLKVLTDNNSPETIPMVSPKITDKKLK